jgi:hypothetical protein
MKTFVLLGLYVILTLLPYVKETTIINRQTTETSNETITDKERACISIYQPSSGKACSVGSFGGEYRCCLVKSNGTCQYVKDTEKALKELSNKYNKSKIDCGCAYMKGCSVCMLLLCVLLFIY